MNDKAAPLFGPGSARPDLVIFDCDGVLVDSEPLAAEAMRNVYLNHGLEIELGHVAAGIGMKQADILDLIEKESGHRLPEGALADLWPETRRLFAERLAATGGIEALLKALEVPVCVASSSQPERIAFSLARTGLAPYFGNAVFSSTMVARGKPAPDLFLHAASEMGAAPEGCVVVEDSRFGIAGAKAAGMRVIGFAGGAHADDTMRAHLTTAAPDAIAASWEEVAALLDVHLI